VLNGKNAADADLQWVYGPLRFWRYSSQVAALKAGSVVSSSE